MKRLFLLFTALLTLAACAAPDVVVRVTEYTANSGPLSAIGMGADGCQLIVTGTIPDDLYYSYDGTKCDVHTNGVPNVPDTPPR